MSGLESFFTIENLKTSWEKVKAKSGGEFLKGSIGSFARNKAQLHINV